MTKKKLKTKEKVTLYTEDSVQLTEDDNEILSEYTWDTAGYTSRFGYFYLGSEKENVKGLTKWQAEHIYQLTPTPPGMEDPLQNMEKTKHIDKEEKTEILKRNEAVADDYLVKANEEKNLLYLSFYLHGYEHRLNARVYSFLRRNGMDIYDPALFLDMKLALQELILKKLPTFDPSRDAKFLTYIHQFIYDAFKEFRMQQECWKIPSLDTYKGIRRMAATYNSCNQNEELAIAQFCEDSGCKPETAKQYLNEAIGIRARQTEVIIDWDENEQAIVEDIASDRKGSMCHILWNHGIAMAVRESFGKLPWREQEILKARNAICGNCGGMRPMEEKYSFREIAIFIMAGRQDKDAEEAYQDALDLLTLQMMEDHPIRVVDLKLEEKQQRKKKIAEATYLYRADCDGVWGRIHFDFQEKRIKLEVLAEWDTVKSHLYAWKVIGYIVQCKELPKKRRILFEEPLEYRPKKTKKIWEPRYPICSPGDAAPL